jgi:AcrR family transcriptional regulator
MDKKKEAIIEGAIKRFIHYGIHKTTINEIAVDIFVSKPSLYYYFPDKSSLIEGVIEKIFADYFEAVQIHLYTDITLEERFEIFNEIRFKFFQKYYMLYLSGVTQDAFLNSDSLKATFMSMKKKNIEMYTDILKRSVEKAEIAEVEFEKTAGLYLESMMGIVSLCIIHRNKEILPSKKEMKITLEKQNNLSRIFVKGLK